MHPSLPPVDRARREAAVRAVLGERGVRRLVTRVRSHLLGDPEAPASTSACARTCRRVRAQGRTFPSLHAPPPLVPEEACTVPAHLAHIATLEHPAAHERAALPRDAEVAVRWCAHELAARGAHAVHSRRDKTLRLLRAMASELRGVNARLEPYVTDAIRAMPQRVNVALLHVLAQAVRSPDAELALGFVFGFPAVGDIPPSGWWPVKVEPAELDFAAMDHDAWVHAAAARACAHSADASALSACGAVAFPTRVLESPPAGSQ